ncbi:MAG: OprO/OprP family phosphate-selective porin, partial [Acidobacteria bacterium]|nr:OprO/OprP family phosphate-selective porin [Acidobacteriota bacterium]MCI0720755.1 OprO/OprP family phosphate-selective porin [Acidobacteriota bacterium]
RFQFRATEKWVTSEPESLSSEFMIRRARLDFAGSFFNQNWNYRIQLAFSNLDMEPDRPVSLRDAYVTWSRLRDLNIRMGQMKVPFDRQRVTSSSALQMVDRSIVVDELNLDRDVGIQILSKDFLGLGRLTYQAGVFGGDGRNRTSDAPGVLWVGRLQFQPFGKLDDVDDRTESDFEHSSDPRLALAAGVARNTSTNRAQSTFGNTYEFARFNYQHWEGDVVFKWNGWSLLGEVMSRSANQPYLEAMQEGQVSREYSRSAWGYFVQSGYLFRNNVELATRYGRVRPMGLTDPALRPMREIGPSLSWYLKENQLKIQSDYFYLLGSENENRKRHQLRLQMQVYF